MEEIPMTNPIIEETVAIAMGEKPPEKSAKAKKPKKESIPLYEHWNTEPSDMDQDGSTLLQALVDKIRHHVVMTVDQATVVALWILLTWVHDKAVVHSPLFLATSPEANSGKTTLLGIITLLVRNSLCSVSISGPALFRSIEKWQPTFVIDEADSALVDNQDLKSVINSGWTRGQSVIRCEVKTNEPKPYSTFCPKALGMKGRKLPDTTLSRAIIVEMQRKRPSEKVADFDHIDDDDLAELRARCARWAADNAEQVKKWEPTIPDGFHNRTRANWKAMLAIAEVCGWQEKASEAACVLENVKDGFGKSIGAQLLSDLRDIFPEGAENMFSRDIVAKLIADAEKPWAEYRHDKPLTQKQLANLMNGFGVFSDTVHQGEAQAKGYKREQLLPLFDRYLTVTPQKPTPEPYKRTSDCGTGTSDKNQTVRENGQYGSENANLSHSDKGLYGCTVQNTPLEGCRCVQCNGTPDGKEQLYSLSGSTIWLHADCARFQPGALPIRSARLTARQLHGLT
jgi:hypothetical protein